ncbi:DUF4340 domain-containing protein [Candidatus Chlorohelix sp.]|uniref:DUF4340 domain-containing protein n=1 Tax=Candidatus Chlorohelix sp. TaxID=3139201 RepID=UPI0030367759
MKRYRPAIAIAVFFAALLVLVLLTQPSPIQAPANVTPTVSAEQLKLQIIKFPEKESPTRLELKRATPAKTTVFKLDGNWKVEGQDSFALDSSTVADTARSLANLSSTQQLADESGTNLATAGLDKPSLEITISGSSFTKTLQVGITNTVTGVYYVKLSDSPKIWVLSPGLIDQLKGWVDQPPPLPPTPTPLPTLPPTPTLLPTVAVSGTPDLNLTPAPTVATTTETATATPPPTTK